MRAMPLLLLLLLLLSREHAYWCIMSAGTLLGYSLGAGFFSSNPQNPKTPKPQHSQLGIKLRYIIDFQITSFTFF